VGDYISAVRGCCPLIFSYTLEIDKALLVHTKMGMRSPPQKKNFESENLKFGLKCSAEEVGSGEGCVPTPLYWDVPSLLVSPPQ